MPFAYIKNKIKEKNFSGIRIFFSQKWPVVFYFYFIMQSQKGGIYLFPINFAN